MSQAPSVGSLVPAAAAAPDAARPEAAPARAARPPRATLPAVVIARAHGAPRAAAVFAGDGRVLRNRALAAAAVEVARALHAEVEGASGSVVAVAAVDPLQHLIGTIGAWLAGAAALPIDPQAPGAWITRVVAHARPVAVLGDGPGVWAARRDDLPVVDTEVLRWTSGNGPLPSEEEVTLLPARPACVLYPLDGPSDPTVLSHAMLARIARSRLTAYRDRPARLLSLDPLGSKPGLAALSWSLACGGALVALADEARRDPWAACEALTKLRVTHLSAGGAAYEALVEASASTPGALESLQRVVICDELLDESVERVHRTCLSQVELSVETALTRRPSSATARVARGRSPAALRGPEERALAALWTEVLGLEPGDVCRDDHFFQRGGDALRADRLAEQLRHRLGRILPIALLYRRPVLADLARELPRLEPAPKPAPSRRVPPPRAERPRPALAEEPSAPRAERAAAPARVEPAGDARPARAPQPAPRPRGALIVARRAPLAPAQLAWFEQGRPAVIEPAETLRVLCRIDGPLDAGRLEGALFALARRHDALRVRVEAAPGQQRPHQLLATPALRLITSDEQPDPPLDLAAGPPWWARLRRVGEDEHRLELAFHPGLVEPEAARVVLGELPRLYAEDDLPPAPAAVAVARQVWRALPARRAEHVAYWAQRLAGAPPATALAWAAASEPTRGRRRGQVARSLTAAEQTVLAALAGRAEASEREVVLAALLGALARRAAAHELVVGTSPSPADPAREGLGRVRPLLPLRLAIDLDRPLVTLAGRVRDQLAADSEHAALPLREVLAAGEAAPGSAPFRLAFEALDLRTAEPAGREPVFEPLLPEHPLPAHEATVFFHALGRGARLDAVFDAAALDPERVSELLGEAVSLVLRSAVDPSRSLAEVAPREG